MLLSSTDFMNLTELEALNEEVLKTAKLIDAKRAEEEGKKEQQHKVRGLFDYEDTKDGDADAKKEQKRKRELRKTAGGFSPSKALLAQQAQQEVLSMFK